MMPETLVSNGFIAIDKPQWLSSFDVIRKLRKITGIRKIGHCGTLDPFATGLLICCIGSYTRLAKYVEAEQKGYSVTIKLGEKTDTGDPEGKITETGCIPSRINDVDLIVSKALAITSLPVPSYSAVKLDGKRAYALARAGQTVVIPDRATSITDFRFVASPDGEIISHHGEVSYLCTVSKGTYIRSLSEWLANQLGTVGYTQILCRESIGNITINTAVKLDVLNQENWREHLLEPKFVLADLLSHTVNEEDYLRISNGGDIPSPKEWLDSNQDVALYNYEGSLIAICEVVGNVLQPRIVLGL
jgi:tRNA pseudouridine55 synthase